jgi:hypothetical protein
MYRTSTEIEFLHLHDYVYKSPRNIAIVFFHLINSMGTRLDGVDVNGVTKRRHFSSVDILRTLCSMHDGVLIKSYNFVIRIN